MSQLSEAGELANRPAGQAVQVVIPIEFAKYPTGHAVHVLVPAYPFAQKLQLSEPDKLVFPTGQVVQAFAPDAAE